MEFPTGLIRLERVFTATLLAGVAAIGILEARSPLARAIRQGKPVICRVQLDDQEAAAVYAMNQASLIWLDRSSWDDFEGAAEAAVLRPDAIAHGPSLMFTPSAKAPENPALGLAAMLTPRTLGAWIAALRPFSFDRLLLLLDLAKLRGGEVRPAYLPQDLADRAAYLAAVFNASRAPPRDRPITVEVLNAAGQKGIAYDVTKFLRSKGADVVHYGNLAGPAAADTIVYDRTGRFEDAEWVRDRLGCPAAAVTQVSAKSLVDVTVVLADDCKL